MTRTMQASRRQRWFWVALSAIWWLSFVGGLIEGAFDPRRNLWLFVIYVVTGGMFLVATVQAYRARVVIDDEGITVNTGVGRVRRARWEQIEDVRHPRAVLPPRIELRDASDIRFDGISGPPTFGRRAFEDLAEEVRSRTSDGGDHQQRSGGS